MLKNKKNKHEYDINAYIGFVTRTIKEPKLRKEIIEQLQLFSNEGTIIIDGSSLYGKILKADGDLYIDIKCSCGKFVCSYTKWDLNSVVTIEQDTLKAGNYKLTKTDKVNYNTCNRENKFETEITEKIYNINNNLLYESKCEIEENFTSSNTQLLYRDDSPYINVVSVEKDWYMPNGSIIKYKMNKNEMHNNKGIEEEYLICKKPYKDEFGTTCYFINLSRELFVELMTGKLTIEEVLEKLDEKEPVKSVGEKVGKKSSN